LLTSESGRGLPQSKTLREQLVRLPFPPGLGLRQPSGALVADGFGKLIDASGVARARGRMGARHLKTAHRRALGWRATLFPASLFWSLDRSHNPERIGKGMLGKGMEDSFRFYFPANHSPASFLAVILNPISKQPTTRHLINLTRRARLSTFCL